MTLHDIPSELFVHPIIESLPPVESKEQELPIDKLSWKNFEKLCLKLARKESDPTGCRLYGTRGQEQGGIDIYGKIKQEDAYYVYQCKHEENFGPKKIEKAVEKFLQGEWADKSKKFVICCKESFDKTQREIEIEKQRKILGGKNIAFETWDIDELNLLLKKHPDIVFDFFGIHWLRVFCGEEIAISYSSKINPIEVTKYLKSCHNLYELLFQKADPGLPFSSEVDLNNVSIEKRFVMPNITKEENLSFYLEENSEEAKSLNDVDNDDDKDSVLDSSLIVNEQVISAIDWFQPSQRFIVSGDAGSGKSTLLRYLMLNLLNNEASDNRPTKIWGDSLPIWLPFAFWTKVLGESNGESISLDQIVRLWLKSWNEDGLWPLFEKALKDEKILLIIDGIDEGYSLDTSKLALNKLDIFLERRKKASCIVSLRPHAHSLLKGSFDEKKWRVAKILEFSKSQKIEFADKWFSIYLSRIGSLRNVDDKAVNSEKNRRVSEFIVEIEKNSDLSKLSSNPLMLSALFFHKVSNISLPTDRLKIYDSLVTQFVKQHPSNRKISTNVANLRTFEDEEVLRAISFISYKLLCNSELTISNEKFNQLLNEFLSDELYGFAYDKSEARKLSKDLYKICVEEISIIVEKYPGNFGFVHKSFLEYFASVFVFRTPFENQKSVFNQRVCDSNWHPTLVFLLLSYERIDEIKAIFLHLLSIMDTNILVKRMVFLVLKDFLPSSKKFPVYESNAILELISREIESIESSEYKKSLIGGFLKFLSHPRHSAFVIKKINEWGTSYNQWRYREIRLLSNWTYSSELIDFLRRGLFDEDVENVVSSARSLVSFNENNSDIIPYLKQNLYEPINDTIRAASFLALLDNHLSAAEIEKFVKFCDSSSNPLLNLLAICGRVKRNVFQDDDFKMLLNMTEFSSYLSYKWRDTVLENLTMGWGTNKKLLNACLQTLNGGPRLLDNECATTLLLNNFSNEPLVHSWIIDQLQDEHNKRPFSSRRREAWNILRDKLVPTEELKKAIDEWLLNQNDIYSPDISAAALITKSEVAKNRLIRMLDDSHPFWAARALLKGWNTAEVQEIILKTFNSSNRNASYLAEEYIKIEKDPSKAKKRIIQILDGNLEECRIDIIAKALLILCDNKFDEDVISKLINIYHSREESDFSHSLIVGGFWHHGVKEIAKKELTKRYGPRNAIIRLKDLDITFQNILLQSLFPLDDSSRHFIANFLADNISLLNSTNAPVLFSRMADEEDTEVLTSMSLGYYKYLAENNLFTQEVLEKVQKNLFALGMSYEAVRGAAFCGLLMANREDLLLHSLKTNQKKIVFDRFEYKVNTVLIKYILSTWIKIKTNFGDDFEYYFLESNREGLSYLNFIPFITSENDDAFHDVYKKATDGLSLRGETISIAEIEFLVRFDVRSSFFEDTLKKLVIKSPGKYYGNDATRLALSFAKYFKDDEDILSFCEKNLFVTELSFNDPLGIAICEMFPESPLIKSLFDFTLKHRSTLSFELSIRLDILVGKPQKIFQFLTECIVGQYAGNERVAAIIYPHISRTVIKRDDFRVYLENSLKNISDAGLELNIFLILNKFNSNNSLKQNWFLEKLSQINMDNNLNNSVWVLQSGRWYTFKEALLSIFMAV